LAALPSVQPGKLWLVEFPPTEPEASPLEYRALTTANVVIYDRSLERAVAKSLPLGGYAEPAAPGDAAWERALRFARDGWSVAKLTDRAVFSGRNIGEFWDFAGLLAELLSPRHPAASVFANLGGRRYEKIEIDLAEISAILGRRPVDQAASLTIIFGLAIGEAAPRFSVASANGLAG
jgi:hypothetical protein